MNKKIKFSDLKVGDEFHMLKFGAYCECNIKISFKSENYATYTVSDSANSDSDLFGRIWENSEILSHIIPIDEYNSGEYKKNECNGCPFLLFTNTTQGVANTQNVYCGAVYGERQKLIDFTVRFDERIDAPNWCPKKDGSVRNAGEGGYFWRDIKPRVKFKDIAVGDEYHVAPYDNEKRKDIRIISKVNNFCTYKIISNEKNYCGYYYLQDGGIGENSLILKFMSKRKK